MIDHFKMFANYNRWANEKLYDACGALSEKEYMRDRQAFFQSIHGTLNHLLLVDILWLGRIQKIDTGITALNQILYPDFSSLYQARKQQDEIVIEFVNQIDTNKMQGNVDFTTLAGTAGSIPFAVLLTHLFNHQTHHRGQVHNMLSQAGMTPPSLDLYYFFN